MRINAYPSKVAERGFVAKKVREFLANGGQITICEPCLQGAGWLRHRKPLPTDNGALNHHSLRA